MKFLLTALNAKYIHSNPAIFSLRNYASEYKESISLAEYTINMSVEEILADIYKKTPDVIGFSCYIWNWTMIQEIIIELHKIMPQLPIWLGGPEVSFDALEICKSYPMITGIMIGEGENTFCELMSYYTKQEIDLKQIKGICTREGYTEERELTDLDTIPFLYQSLDEFENRIIYYESSRGCPFRCSYCLSSIDKKVRLRNLDIVKQELLFFITNKVAQVKFVDRTFNCNQHHALEIWRFIKENDNGITNFHFEISADILSEEEIALLNSMRPGLVQLEIGVQSTNKETINEIRRMMDVVKLKNIVRSIKKGNNIHIHLDLIAGLPFENLTIFKQSFNEVYEMEPEQLQLGFLKVLKGSYMHDKYKDYEIEYRTQPPYEVLMTKWLSYQDILQLKQVEEMVEVYYNSNQFVSTMKYLVSLFTTPFEAYWSLAQYYDEKGYFIKQPSRMYRYEVLLEFAETIPRANLELIKELLTFDLYLRENLKSRPAFAKKTDEAKEVGRLFFIQEEEKRALLPHYKEYNVKQLTRMLHIEAFDYAVWEKEITEKRNEKPSYLLFDYQNRNPYTHDASFYRIENTRE